MNGGRTIQRNDHVVHICGNLCRESVQKQPAAQQCHANPAGPEQFAKAKEIRVHQRFAAGQDHPFHAEALDAIHLRFQLCQTDFFY